MTYDGSNVTYYLDGTLPTFSALQNSFADPGLALSNLTYIGIGGGSPWPDNTINGKVYDFRIYGQVLALPISLTQSNSVAGLTLSWPSYAIGFGLESSPVLGGSAAWTRVAQTPALLNDCWQLTLPATNSTLFFRLRR